MNMHLFFFHVLRSNLYGLFSASSCSSIILPMYPLIINLYVIFFFSFEFGVLGSRVTFFFFLALPSKNFFSLLSFRPCEQLHFDWSWQVLWILDHPTWTYEPLDTLFSILTFARGKLLHHNHYSSSSLSSSCAKNISPSLILVDYNWRRLKELGYWVFFLGG